MVWEKFPAEVELRVIQENKKVENEEVELRLIHENKKVKTKTMGIAQKQHTHYLPRINKMKNTLVLFRNITYFLNVSLKISSATYISKETDAQIE